MWIKIGDMILNADKVKMFSVDLDTASEKTYMLLNAFVEDMQEPITLAMTPAVGDSQYQSELLALKSYIKMIYKGLQEGWVTYELGKPIAGFSMGERIDLTSYVPAIKKTIELARVCREALTAGDKNKSEEQEHKLVSHLASLTHEQRDTILALCWFGRDDFEYYESAVKHTNSVPSQDVAGYLSGKSPLDEYLTAGFKRLAETP